MEVKDKRTHHLQIVELIVHVASICGVVTGILFGVYAIQQGNADRRDSAAEKRLQSNLSNEEKLRNAIAVLSNSETHYELEPVQATQLSWNLNEGIAEFQIDSQLPSCRPAFTSEQFVSGDGKLQHQWVNGKMHVPSPFGSFNTADMTARHRHEAYLTADALLRADVVRSPTDIITIAKAAADFEGESKALGYVTRATDLLDSGKFSSFIEASTCEHAAILMIALRKPTLCESLLSRADVAEKALQAANGMSARYQVALLRAHNVIRQGKPVSEVQSQMETFAQFTTIQFSDPGTANEVIATGYLSCLERLKRQGIGATLPVPQQYRFFTNDQRWLPRDEYVDTEEGKRNGVPLAPSPPLAGASE